jgi:hypothetical protein
MKDLFLRILREETRQINELDVTGHIFQRFNQRFNLVNEYDVVYQTSDNRYIPIGKYKINPQVIENINKKFEFINSIPEKIDDDITVAVVLGDIYRNPENIIFIGNTPEEKLENKEIYDEYETYLSEPKPKDGNRPSVGRYLVMIIQNNSIVSTLLSPFANDKYLNDHVTRDIHKQLIIIRNPRTEWKEKLGEYFVNPNKVSPEPTETIPVSKISNDKLIKKLHYLNSLKIK